MTVEELKALRQAALHAGDDVGFPGTSEHAERFAIAWSPETCLRVLDELAQRWTWRPA